MLPGLRDPQGRAYAILGSPAGTRPRQGGIALSDVGQIFYSTVLTPATDRFNNGFLLSATGQLIVAPGGVIANYLEGLPRTAAGALVVQIDVVPAASDPFLGGLRIGPLGGVYLTTTTPP